MKNTPPPALSVTTRRASLPHREPSFSNNKSDHVTYLQKVFWCGSLPGPGQSPRSLTQPRNPISFSSLISHFPSLPSNHPLVQALQSAPFPNTPSFIFIYLFSKFIYFKHLFIWEIEQEEEGQRGRERSSRRPPAERGAWSRTQEAEASPTSPPRHPHHLLSYFPASGLSL